MIALLFVTSQLAGQIINPKETAKRKAEDRTNRGIDRTLDRGLDKVEEGIGSIFKKKKKKEPTPTEPTVSETKTTPQNGSSNAPAYDPPVTVTDKQGNTDYSAYKDFNFVPGENIIFFDDFADHSKKRWGAYDIDSDVKVVNVEGKNWLEVRSRQFFPLGLKTLPKNFTLEFDVYTPDINTGTLAIRFVDKSQADQLADPWLDNSGEIDFSPISQMPKTGLGTYLKRINNNEVSSKEYNFYSWQPELGNHFARISLSCTDNKVSVWVNKEQVMDNTDLLANNLEYLLSFHLQSYFVAENRMYLTNIRLATGNANPKTEITTHKVFVTQNIYFDVASDVIRPNSYAVLKQIAESIQSIDGNILIVGHTDSDGSDAANLVLSQKRAASVKRALVNEFGIDGNRLTTDGKGESMPLNKNATPAEKAQNRRVEFIQQ